MHTWICEKIVQHRLQNGPKSFKIEVWGPLGALWDPSWRPSGTGAITRAQKVEKLRIFGSPRGPKIEKKSIQNHVKKCMIFYIGFGMTFSRSGDDFSPKNLSKIRSPSMVFRPCCWYAECVILNDSTAFLLYFSLFETKFLIWKSYFFACFI